MNPDNTGRAVAVIRQATGPRLDEGMGILKEQDYTIVKGNRLDQASVQVMQLLYMFSIVRVKNDARTTES